VPIVTGYEDTPGGHDALVLGAQLTRLTGLGAIVVTVYPTDGRGIAAVAHDPRWLPRVRKVALARFVRARELIGEGWGAIEPEFAALGPGPVAPVLSDFADEVGAAVLVVGSTGHGLLGRITPGGTVQRLLPTSHCPMAIAPRGYRHTAGAGILSIAVAYDGSPEADRASVLRFVTVAPTPEDEPAARAMAHKGVATAPLDIDALADVVVGPVARVLADLPERTDILVIGSRGYRFMRRLLLGGVAGALVRSARYPVVIVPSLG
jgi:nucleotide-binding universal stress UspA family protein